MTEAQHQTCVFKWAAQPSIRSKWPCLKLLHHVPNGGKRDKIEAAHMKQQGVKPGIPDLDLPVARGKYHGLRIEMKDDTGRTSIEQDWWLGELREQGYFCEVCHGWESAVRVLEWYLAL
ncbi:MAG: VRR-NUC domain-containing protein [Clostridium sp.]|uniref:VRR-NUC domain-containing protein n=1 Tax=Clostridium sp. TaxID=1506 RepID=UPI00290BADB5|nr:VRR-NUC domain-containing protein [Clostridium sp.]MDU7338593.1 VRR-NUC domain-containing protein [Clostridium sp.]